MKNKIIDIIGFALLLAFFASPSVVFYLAVEHQQDNGYQANSTQKSYSSESRR